MTKKHIHCPVNGWDCPYYSDNPIHCQCTINDPFYNCDDFASIWDVDDDWMCDCTPDTLEPL